MIVLVSGGKNFDNAAQMKRVLDQVIGWSPTGKVRIVTGGATGADTLAKLWAIERGEEHVEYPIAKDKAQAAAIGAMYDWETFGKSAGSLRNQLMLDRERVDQAVVFPGQNDTLDMLTKLFANGVNTWVVGRTA